MKLRILVAVLAAGLMACSDEDNDLDGGADAQPDAPLGVDSRDGGGGVDANLDGASDARANDTRVVDANTSQDAPLPLSDARVGGDAGGDAGGDVAILPSSITAIVTAVAGGQIPLQGATVLALKGSVATDTAITLTATPPSAQTPRLADVNGMIYSVEPSFLQFDAPVQLTVASRGTLPQGQQASLAYLETGGTWTVLPSTWDDKTSQVSALIARAGRYALLVSPSSPDVTCPAATTCGGTLAGTYQYSGECSRTPTVNQPVACGPVNTAVVSTTAVRTGGITFSGLTFATNTTTSRRADVRTDTACTAYGQNAGDATCADLASRLMQSKLYTWTCSGDINNRCFCSGSLQEPQQLSGAFFTSEGRLTLTPLVGANETTQNYCVAGSNVTVGDANTVLTLTKAP